MSMRIQIDYSDIYKQLDAAQGLAGKAVAFGLYDTAAIVAQACREEAAGLSFPHGKPGTAAAIAASIGPANFRRSATGRQTSVGPDGYFPSGFPIPYFVNELEHGTSRIPANPFMQRAAARSIAQAEAKGLETAEQIIKEKL